MTKPQIRKKQLRRAAARAPYLLIGAALAFGALGSASLFAAAATATAAHTLKKALKK